MSNEPSLEALAAAVITKTAKTGVWNDCFPESDAAILIHAIAGDYGCDVRFVPIPLLQAALGVNGAYYEQADVILAGYTGDETEDMYVLIHEFGHFCDKIFNQTEPAETPEQVVMDEMVACSFSVVFAQRLGDQELADYAKEQEKTYLGRLKREMKVNPNVFEATERGMFAIEGSEFFNSKTTPQM